MNLTVFWNNYNIFLETYYGPDGIVSLALEAMQPSREIVFGEDDDIQYYPMPSPVPIVGEALLYLEEPEPEPQDSGADPEPDEGTTTKFGVQYDFGSNFGAVDKSKLKHQLAQAFQWYPDAMEQKWGDVSDRYKAIWEDIRDYIESQDRSGALDINADGQDPGEWSSGYYYDSSEYYKVNVYSVPNESQYERATVYKYTVSY